MSRLLPIIAAFAIATVLTAAAGWMIFGSHGRADGQTDRRHDAVAHEWRLASAEHKNIAEAVAVCSGATNFATLPASVRQQLRLDILPDGARRGGEDRRGGVLTVALDSRSGAVEPRGETSLALSNYARTAIYLSDEIMRSRIESANNAYVNHWVMVGFQWIIVFIGALTTILISLKSIMTADEGARAWSMRIGIAAILCSSIGTAASALNTFYGPREAYLKAERSLAALRQLHSDIAIQIGSIRETQGKKECPGFDPANKDDALFKQVQDWKTKLGAIVNASDSGSSYPSETTVPDQASASLPNQ